MQKAQSVRIAVIGYEDETVRRYNVDFGTFEREFFQQLHKQPVAAEVIVGKTLSELEAMFSYVVYEGGLCASDFE